MRERHRYTLGVIGATLLALATIPPDTAVANITGWMRLLFGFVAAPGLGVWLTIGVILLGVFLVLTAIAWHIGAEPDPPRQEAKPR